MGVYDRAIATALRQITKYGQSVTWRQISSDTAVDATKPWKGNTPSSNTTDYSVKIAFFSLNKEDQEDAHFMNQTRPSESNRINVNSFTELGLSVNLVGNKIGFMGSVSFTPSVRDVIVRGTKQYRILAIDVLDPNGTPIMYTITLES